MPPRFANMLGFLGSGSPELEASLTLGHCIIPFLCTLVVQIGTMKCFYCPQKDVSLVPWDSLSSADQTFLRDKYPDAGQGAVCEFCVRSARPSAFFSRRSLLLFIFFVIFLGYPGQKRARVSKISLNQLTPLGYSESAQLSRAHEKKKRRKLKRPDQVTPRTLPKTCFGLWVQVTKFTPSGFEPGYHYPSSSDDPTL